MSTFIEKDYLKKIQEGYSNFIKTEQDLNVLTIDVSELDFVNNENDLEEVIKYIRQPVSGTKFFNPVSGLK